MRRNHHEQMLRYEHAEALRLADLALIESERQADLRLSEAKALAAETALKLQASEYERRLEALNGEYSHISANLAATVSRDSWDGWTTAVDQRFKGVEIGLGACATNSDVKAMDDKLMALIAPFLTYMATQQGQAHGSAITRASLFTAVLVVCAVVTLVVLLANGRIG